MARGEISHLRLDRHHPTGRRATVRRCGMAVAQRARASSKAQGALPEPRAHPPPGTGTRPGSGSRPSAALTPARPGARVRARAATRTLTGPAADDPTEHGRRISTLSVVASIAASLSVPPDPMRRFAIAAAVAGAMTLAACSSGSSATSPTAPATSTESSSSVDWLSGWWVTLP